jgi:predicted nucleotidyltransferase component of viral defense system
MLKGKGTLTSIQKSLLVDFGKIRDASFFYLTGGTALAEFYLGHRRSYDLDFFTPEKELIIPFTRDMEESLFRQQFTFSVIRRFESFVEFEVSKEGESIRLHFAYDSPFRFEEPHPSEFGVRINDYQDIIVDKLLTFFGRAEPRDAVDLFFRFFRVFNG